MSRHAAPAWSPGPERPRLHPRSIHVWRADLTAVGDTVEHLLSPAERARAERVARTRAGRVSRSSVGVLRALLGLYLDRDPSTLPIAVNAHGKPALAGSAGSDERGAFEEPARAVPSFSHSHSGALALYAFASSGSVGIDVELGRPSIDVLARAGRAFGGAEVARLAALEEAPRLEEFLRMWVRREARLKCLGVGLGGRGGVGDASPPPEPWVHELTVDGHVAAAVAATVEPDALLCWDWPPA